MTNSSKIIISLLHDILENLGDKLGAITEHKVRELIEEAYNTIEGGNDPENNMKVIELLILDLSYGLYNDDENEGALGDIVKLNLITDNLHIATPALVGVVKPDGTSIASDFNGTIMLNPTWDCVVELKIFGGGESGYRKWRNGRLEQWGVATTSEGETEFTLHIAFKDLLFGILATPREKGNFYIYAIPSANLKMKVRISDLLSIYRAIKFQWKAEGYWK